MPSAGPLLTTPEANGTRSSGCSRTWGGAVLRDKHRRGVRPSSSAQATRTVGMVARAAVARRASGASCFRARSVWRRAIHGPRPAVAEELRALAGHLLACV
jgi:hypothetical protein